MLKAACIQMNSGAEILPNLKQAEDLIRRAAGQGAQLILTPENTCHMRGHQNDKLKTAQTEDHHIALPFFSDLAQELKIWLLIGSLSIKLGEQTLANRSFLLNDQGHIVSRYDKIHLFDVDLPTGEHHRESAVVKAGTKAIAAETPWGLLGMSICYDLRFPALYQDLARAGVSLLAIPAAFTVPTGMAHWETLLRARAIETGSFVLAPAQCGTHEGGRQTYGHSMMISPWGKVMAEENTNDTGFIMADLDLSEVTKARNAIPSLQHQRDYIPPAIE